MGKLIDYTNQKIGKLTVLKRAQEKVKHGESAKWQCLCQCGKICIKSSSDFRRGNTSCGHDYGQKLSERSRIDYTGKRFGKLTVIEYSHSKNKRAMWKCICDCGKECIVTGKYLKNGDTKSCGCLTAQVISKLKKKPIQPGTKFGKLTVMFQLEQRRNKMIYYRCQCQCGNYTDVQASHLRQNDIRSCGCVHSFSEIYITQFLIKNKIKYERQFKFENCRSRKNRKLPFDFAIFDQFNKLKCLIQFQGEQHYKNTFGSTKQQYEEYILHDIVKRNYCHENNIDLYEITYKDNLEEKLLNIFDMI